LLVFESVGTSTVLAAGCWISLASSFITSISTS